MTRLATTLLCCSALLACGDDSDSIAPETETYTIFSQGLDGWVPENLGLEPGSTFEVTTTQFGAQFDIESTAAGGEAVLTREYIVTPGVRYVVSIDMSVESSDGTVDLEPWTIVVGTSVEGGDFDMTDAFSTRTTGGATAQVLPIFGDIAVTAGPPQGTGDTESEVRVAIGFRPLSADARTYRIREARIVFVRADRL